MHTRSDRTFILSVVLSVLLALWGGFTLFAYLGSTGHASVLMGTADTSFSDQPCAALMNVRLIPSGETGIQFCKGIFNFWGSMTHSIARMAPLGMYLILSLLAYAVFLGVQWFKRERMPETVTLRPWQVVLVFLGMVWLLFLVISYGSVDNIPTRYIFEPTPQIYQGASPQTLEALQENFDRLQSAGCLRPAQYGNIPAYAMTGMCLQGQFVKNVVSQLLFILVLMAEFLILGRALLRLLRVRPEQSWMEALLSLGLGACGWMVMLWVLSVARIYTPLAGWALAVLVPAALYPHTLHWVRQFLSLEWETRLGKVHVRSFLFWLLLSYLAFNFLTVIRPFPIGWDDLGSYVNRPRLLVSYGHFIPTVYAFQWEYLTSLGFLLFGYDTAFGATAAMQVNWMAGLLAVLTVWGFGRAFFGAGGGIVSALLYYLLPLVGHFSFADMKIDNAVFALGSLSLLCLFLALFPLGHHEAEGEVDGDAGEMQQVVDWRWLALAGVFCGFAFGVKPTAAMVLTAALALILGAHVGGWGYAAGGFLSAAIFSFQGILNTERILQRLVGQPDLVSRSTVALASLLLAVALLGISAFRGRSLRRAGISVGIFVVGFLVSVGPWILHNNILSGNVVPRLLLGAPNTISPHFVLDSTKEPETDRTRVLPASLALDPNNPLCKSTALEEELDRYWGFRQGWRHYIGAPWRSVMNLDSGGYYVTELPVILLFPLLLVLPFFWRRSGRALRGLFIVTFLLIAQWVFLANGVPWYGIGMFLGLTVGAEALVRYAPNRVSKTIAGVLIACSIIIALGMRFWQFEMQQNLYEYGMGKVSARVLEERTIPWYDDIRNVVIDRHNTFTERPYLYRMGTFIPYFIPKNLEVIGNADNQLDFFNCLHQERDPALTLRRLNALGFNAIIFDTNTATIESNPNGTLHQKVNAFLDFANSPVIGPFNIQVNDPQAGVAFITLPETPVETGTGATAPQ